MGRPHALLRLAGRPLLHQRSVLDRSTTASKRTIVVLGIETSADDACAALLRVEGQGTNRIVYPLHEDRISCANAKNRGIHPYEAVVSHTQHLAPMLQRLMQHSAKTCSQSPPSKATPGVTNDSQQGTGISSTPSYPKPDLIAVTRGPGMGGCLGVGVTSAKALAAAWSIPIIGVHHMQAHALTPMMEAAMARGAGTPPKKEDDPRFPFLTLLISGKHTMLVHTKSNTDHKILATVNTTALGDMLDKCAREILPESWIPADADTVVYPRLMEQFVAAEPEVQSYAPPEKEGRAPKVYTSARYGWAITPPLRLASKTLQFDFTGFGGLIREIVRARPDMDIPERKELAVQTMKLSFEHILNKVVLALRTVPDLVADPPSTLILSGGVASNLFLRRVAETTLQARGLDRIKVLAPAMRYCTDNAPMVAFAGAQMYEEEGWETDLGFAPKITWSIEEILSDADCWGRRPGF